MAKRYYWLKLQHDFFSSKRIKKLRKIAGGDTYTIIYLKMQLKAIADDGCLTYSGIEPTFAEELALDIDENPDDVNVTINFLLQYGLMETLDNTNFSLPYAIENTGSGDSSTERVRKFRERQKELPLHETQCNVTCNADCNVEIEKEKEKEIDSEIEGEKKKRAKKFVAPTLEEVKAYANSRKSHVDPVKFWEYYDTGDWKDEKGQPVRNWKQKFLTWEKTDTPSKAPRTVCRAAEAKASQSTIDDLDRLIEEMQCENL